MNNLTNEEFAERINAMMGHGPWLFRSFRPGVHISRADEYVMRQGAQGLAMVKESKAEIAFVDHQYRTSDPETALYLQTLETRHGGIGKQYIEVTELDDEELAAASEKPPRLQIVKKWGRTKADALQALGQRKVPLADLKRPTWATIMARAEKYNFELEGREVE